MKIVLRIFFVLLFCYMALAVLKISNVMVQEEIAPFSETINRYAVRGMKKKLEVFLAERDEKKKYIESEGIGEEVDQILEELHAIVEAHAPDNYKVKAYFGKIITFALGYLSAFLSLMVVAGLIIKRFRNIKIVWGALLAQALHYVFILQGASLVNMFLLLKWSPNMIAFVRLMEPSFEGKPFTIINAVRATSFFAWSMHLMFLLYLILCIFYFKSSFYQEKESVA